VTLKLCVRTKNIAGKRSRAVESLNDLVREYNNQLSKVIEFVERVVFILGEQLER